jgi:pyruvate,orthophosphate dikinase
VDEFYFVTPNFWKGNVLAESDRIISLSVKPLDGKPATIRLLDPPLHEFLPKEDSEIKAVAKELGVKEDKLREKISELHEQNPMLGHRGCRLGISFPEITEMQTRAIIEAAIEVKSGNKKLGKKIEVNPEIMIPLTGHWKELKHQKEVVDKTASSIIAASKVKVSYKVGTMIEVPRGALTADELAEYAEFFSFGTNDLTQMGCGFSRDDAGKFLKEYVQLGIYEKDPFQTLDQDGVGQLIKIGVEKGRKAKPGLKIGICGEHGGDPASIEFCHKVGMNYVSCSPYRVPVAKLAAAQAALKDLKDTEKIGGNK